MTARECLTAGPCTAPELAAILGITLAQANGRLQALARKGAAVRSNRACPPIDKTRGRYPHIWEITPLGNRARSA